MRCGCENGLCEAEHRDGACSATAVVKCEYVGGLCSQCAEYMDAEYLGEALELEDAEVVGAWEVVHVSQWFYVQRSRGTADRKHWEEAGRYSSEELARAGIARLELEDGAK